MLSTFPISKLHSYFGSRSQSRFHFHLLHNPLHRISTSRMTPHPIHQYEIGQRLDRFLKKSQIGWTEAQKILRKKDILVVRPDGEVVNWGDYRLGEGDVLMVSRIFQGRFGKEIGGERAVPREQACRILNRMLLFDNQHISILNKLPGYSVQGGLNPHTNLFSLLASAYPSHQIHTTHRLDRPTSGLVLFAKNRQTAQLVQSAMQDKITFGKYYVALGEGKGKIGGGGYVRCNVQWTGKNRARLCGEGTEGSKDCITFYMPLLGYPVMSPAVGSKKGKEEEGFYRNLFGIKLLTGRKHQIRCHLSSYLGQPILNDSKYGGRKIGSSLATKQTQNSQTQPQQQQQQYQQQQQDSKIFLHAMCLKITKKQILEKIIPSSYKAYTNLKLGTMELKKDSIIFNAKLPTYWQEEIGDRMGQGLKLDGLVEKIDGAQGEIIGGVPKKRRVTSIQ